MELQTSYTSLNIAFSVDTKLVPMNESPFVKKTVILQREPTALQRFWRRICNFVHDTVIESIPSDSIKQLSPRYLYAMVALLFAFLLTIFLVMLIHGYKTVEGQYFLLPSNSYVAEKYCEVISTTITGTFYATEDGLWEGQTGFYYSQAAYAINVERFSTTYEKYKAAMDAVSKSLQHYGSKAEFNDLAANLLIWMTLSFLPDDGNNADRFTLTGTPLAVFDSPKTTGMVSNAFADCNASSVAAFDKQAGYFSLSYDYDEFIANPTCNTVMDPSKFDYVEDASGQRLSISIDSRTLVTALAVNNGIISLDRLEEIVENNQTFLYESVTYHVGFYYDPYYVGMEPIICFSIDGNQLGPKVCLLEVSETFAFPLFNHVGASTSVPTPCNCSNLSKEYLDDYFSLCNEFNFLTGFVFYNSSFPGPLLSLVLKENSTANINGKAFNASFVASYFGQTSPDRDVINEQSYRQSMFEFCNVTFGECSIVTFTSFNDDSSVLGFCRAISNYYFQLSYGACRNTFYKNDNAWEKLVEIPFAPLVEPYQQCHENPTYAFLNELGISISNIGLLTPLSIGVVLAILYLYTRCFQVRIPKSYSKQEKNSALNALAIALLLARDKRLRQQLEQNGGALEQKSLISSLVNELTEYAEITENHYATKVKPKRGLNWKHLVNRTKKVKKFFRSSSMKPAADANGSTINPLSGGVGVEDARATDLGRCIEITEIISAQSAVEIVQSVTACDLALAEDPDLIILNRPASGQELVPIETLEDALSLISGFTSSLKTLTATKDGRGTSEYWMLCNRLARLGALKLSTDENNVSKLSEFYQKLTDMVLLHASLALNCSPKAVLEVHGRRTAYFVHGEVLLLCELNHRRSVR